jgi:hypothetical protein
MDDREHLVITATRIAEIVRIGGHRDRADWIDQRIKVLEDHSTISMDWQRARSDLHRIVLGMGGLFDLRLVDPGGAGQPSTALRVELDGLADQLYRLTG